MRFLEPLQQLFSYLDLVANMIGNPGLLPKDRELRARAQELHQTIHDLNIEALSYGAAIYDDLGINPKAPYNCMTNRSQMLGTEIKVTQQLGVSAISVRLIGILFFRLFASTPAETPKRSSQTSGIC